MQYRNVVEGKFIRRPNRFIAHVEVDGREEVVHVKNTGRCRELLVPGARVFLEKSSSTARKTAYDLIAVMKGDLCINMDSQVPNQVAAEWLQKVLPGANIRREVTWGNSRFDFYIEVDGRKIFMEVKGVTLEESGVALFPDAPTLRGIKHLKVLFSTEDPLPSDPSALTDEELPEGRRALPGSVAFVPSVAGLIIAGEVIKDLIK